jgi:kynurenine formamidase
MKDIVYLSHPLANNTPLYGGANNIQIQPNATIRSGDSANSLKLSFPNHASTHVDVPYHFIDDGQKLTSYDASFWIFNHPVCIDVLAEEGYLISYNDVVGKINKKTDLLLIRTGYETFRSEPKYWQNNPGLSSNLAKGLRTNYPNIRALGVDVISISSRLHRQKGRKAHREFLGSHYGSEPIVLIEDMSLINYRSEISRVIVLPLMILGADGAPCTVIGKVIEKNRKKTASKDIF